jgi:7-cyano-7-deazaguanine synthase
MNRAISLLSGGLDSATTLAIAMADGHQVTAVTFDYGQKAEAEIKAAAAVAKQLAVPEHVLLRIDLRQIGGSALTSNLEIPLQEPEPDSIPITYVPARNTILLSYALALAEVKEAQHIYIGVNSLDYSGYPDCRPEYLQAYETMANLATRAGVTGKHIHIHAPLLYLSKADIIRQGAALGVDYGLTVSCYAPAANGLACGLCESCRIRRKGFAEVGSQDPIKYDKEL